MSVIKIEKWYHEGMVPVWKIQCPICDRIYYITESQKFICDCRKNEINLEEWKDPSLTGQIIDQKV